MLFKDSVSRVATGDVPAAVRPLVRVEGAISNPSRVRAETLPIRPKVTRVERRTTPINFEVTGTRVTITSDGVQEEDVLLVNVGAGTLEAHVEETPDIAPATVEATPPPVVAETVTEVPIVEHQHVEGVDTPTAEQAIEQAEILVANAGLIISSLFGQPLPEEQTPEEGCETWQDTTIDPDGNEITVWYHSTGQGADIID